MSSRRTAGPLRGISGLLLRAVPAASLVPIPDPRCVEGAPDDLVADAGKVLHTSPEYLDDRVLLEVVPLTGDVGGDLGAAGQAHPGHLAQSRVRLLGGVGIDPRAHAPSLGCASQSRGLGLGCLRHSTLADELRNRGHALPLRLNCGVACGTEHSAHTGGVPVQTGNLSGFARYRANG